MSHLQTSQGQTVSLRFRIFWVTYVNDLWKLVFDGGLRQNPFPKPILEEAKNGLAFCKLRLPKCASDLRRWPRTLHWRRETLSNSEIVPTHGYLRVAKRAQVSKCQDNRPGVLYSSCCKEKRFVKCKRLCRVLWLVCRKSETRWKLSRSCRRWATCVLHKKFLA